MNKMPRTWAIAAHKKLVRKMKRRLLRSYRRLAQQDHGTCWNCNLPIFAGDEYEAGVWAVKNPPWLPERRSVIEVRKNHVYCPEDPYEEHLKEMEEERRQEQEHRERNVAA